MPDETRQAWGTPREFAQPVRGQLALSLSFAQLYRDGDGILEWMELTSHYLLDIAAGGQGVPGALSQLLPVPVVLVPVPQRREPEPRKLTNAPAWFRATDRHGDNDISRREFVGNDEEFRRLDLDGDGLIRLGRSAAGNAFPPSHSRTASQTVNSVAD